MIGLAAIKKNAQNGSLLVPQTNANPISETDRRNTATMIMAEKRHRIALRVLECLHACKAKSRHAVKHDGSSR
jgi:hypothetical protein